MDGSLEKIHEAVDRSESGFCSCFKCLLVIVLMVSEVFGLELVILTKEHLPSPSPIPLTHAATTPNQNDKINLIFAAC